MLNMESSHHSILSFIINIFFFWLLLNEIYSFSFLFFSFFLSFLLLSFILFLDIFLHQIENTMGVRLIFVLKFALDLKEINIEIEILQWLVILVTQNKIEPWINIHMIFDILKENHEDKRNKEKKKERKKREKAK
jgi:signal transduction histidine kinase